MNLEPDAKRIAEAVNKYIESGNTASDGELNAAAIMSIAISLKRIADAFVGAIGVDGEIKVEHQS